MHSYLYNTSHALGISVPCNVFNRKNYEKTKLIGEEVRRDINTLIHHDMYHVIPTYTPLNTGAYGYLFGMVHFVNRGGLNYCIQTEPSALFPNKYLLGAKIQTIFDTPKFFL